MPIVLEDESRDITRVIEKGAITTLVS